MAKTNINILVEIYNSYAVYSVFFVLYFFISLVCIFSNNFILPFNVFAGKEKRFRLDQHPSPASTVGGMASISN